MPNFRYSDSNYVSYDKPKFGICFRVLEYICQLDSSVFRRVRGRRSGMYSGM